ncbi:MAG: hypothetical protein QM496_14855 [Verrucomicrobiota bacterium]
MMTLNLMERKNQKAKGITNKQNNIYGFAGEFVYRNPREKTSIQEVFFLGQLKNDEKDKDSDIEISNILFTMHPSILMLRSLKVFIVVVGCACVGEFSLLANEFSKPNDTIGYANCFGNLQFTGHLGAIELSKTEVYNFYFQYSSYSEYESPLLGKGFFVPMLESSLIDNDYFIEVTTLGGATIYLYRLPADPERYVSLNGKNSALKVGSDKFIRKSKDGFILEYNEGQLMRVQTPKGNQLIFEYKGGHCKTVRSSSGAVVCSINRINDKQGVFTTKRGRYKLEFQIHPVSKDPELHPSNLPPLYTLKTITWPNGAETQLSYADIPGSDDIKMQMRYQDDVMDFIWNKNTEQLSVADKVDYRISPLRREGDYSQERTVTGVYTIHRRFENNTWESFTHDEDAGYSDVEKSTGELIRTYYINTRGAVFNLVSKRERIRKSPTENSSKVFYEAFYDVEGKLLRQVNEGKITWHLRKGGVPESVVKGNDNLIRYDEKGRVVESRLDDSLTKTRWLKNDVSRVVSRHPWGETTLRYYDKYGDSLPLPAGENYSQLLQPISE